MPTTALTIGSGDATIHLQAANEDQAHFSLWCMLASPIIAGNDVRSMSDATKAILTNRHAIAVSQDALGKQGVLTSSSADSSTQTWV